METDFYKEILDHAYNGIYFVDPDRRITYWNGGAERLTGYSASEVVGRHCADNILMHVDDCGERLCSSGTCPAAMAMAGPEPRELELELYLHHKDGHRVPVITRVTPITDAGGSVAGAVEVFSDNTAQVESRLRIRELEQLALLDGLTGLGNRRHGEIHVEARLDQLRRYGWPFGLLFFDIDHFKDVNDAHGHAFGDDVLRMVARTAQGSVRSFDILSRWGGEEFIAIIENVTEKELKLIAEKLLRLVEQSSLTADGRRVNVTVSVGATLGLPGDTVGSLVERADRLMYAGKEAGRNRLTLG